MFLVRQNIFCSSTHPLYFDQNFTSTVGGTYTLRAYRLRFPLFVTIFRKLTAKKLLNSEIVLNVTIFSRLAERIRAGTRAEIERSK